MELRRLRYFLSVSSEGSLGKASRELGIAQPALGRQIQMMEAELGVVLFRRTPKGMRLTEEGEYLKRSLDHPLELIDIALRNVRKQTLKVEASLAFGLPPHVAQTFGIRLIARLRSVMPTLRLRITEGSSTKLAADLASNAVDMAILIGIFPPEEIFRVEAMREPLLLVAPADSEVAGLRQIPFARLPDFPLVLPDTPAGLRTQLAKAELGASVHLDVAVEIDSIELRKDAVRAGLGYAILPRSAFRREAERGELIGVPIVDPELVQIIRLGIRPLWRVPRETFDAVANAIFDEWRRAVEDGDWPGEWLEDRSGRPQGTNGLGTTGVPRSDAVQA